jgi:hypothetical protein
MSGRPPNGMQISCERRYSRPHKLTFHSVLWDARARTEPRTSRQFVSCICGLGCALRDHRTLAVMPPSTISECPVT